MRFRFVQILRALLLVTFLLPSIYLFAQDRKTELENTKKRIEEEINYTSKLLEETRKSKQMSLNELTMLQSRIRQRENLVATIQKQLIQLETQLTRTRRDLNRIESELEGLKKEYARMIAFAYKNRSGLNKMMFLFAADDFNQAYRRLKYLQQYSAMRQKQIDLISEAQS
ncbi:MAG: hypothetical protein Q7V19_02445, partial [Bacteroidales bacterium]|nr:hypothetical protein [Bacteroidales bacterium]